LTDGTVTFEVDQLAEGERFRVVVGDAVVEVHGTVFDVTAEDDRLLVVHVISGEVEVRPTAAPDAILTTGEWWRRPARDRTSPDATGAAPAVAAASAPESEPAPQREPPVRAHTPRPTHAAVASTTSTPAIAAAAPAPAAPADAVADDTRGAAVSSQAVFDQGWTAMRGGDYATAARALEVVAAGNDPIAEDASYWLAVAHARAGRVARATHALIAFLSRFPGSPRAGEASLMLGWKLLAAGDEAGAEARFRAAIDDPVARVRSGARQGLEAIGRGD
jgi:TolA-binding protein